MACEEVNATLVLFSGGDIQERTPAPQLRENGE